MKNVGLFMLFVFSIVLAYGFAFSINNFEGKDGKELFTDKKCNMCHSVESMEISSKKKDASDLSAVGDEYDAEFLAKYLQKEEAIDGEKHKMKWKGTDEGLKTLSAWLAELKSAE